MKKTCFTASASLRGRAISYLLKFPLVVGVFATATYTMGAAPPATVSFSADRGETITATIVGTPTPTGGQAYVATFAAEDDSWKVTFNVTADYTNDPTTSLLGTITVVNSTVDTHVFRAGINVPVCPFIEGGSLLGGTGKLTLTSSGPGSLSCADQEGVIQPLADGEPVAWLFYCPFAIATTGSAVMSSSAQFGLPGPNAPGPASFGSIGARIAFTLTGSDTGAAQVTLLFKDVDGYTPPECPWDINFSGDVDGSDLSELIASWGETNVCPSNLPSDIDGDGVVDASDLIAVINNWGRCGN
ncbi:MAG: hypothetical protein SGJ09_17085 [Phycisphaerae bacterium]|nr:hypothetical protein [Phycisphaerae bacterium]